jgi:hypothetical protein
VAALDPAIERKGRPLFILTFFAILDGRLKGGHGKERSFAKVSCGRRLRGFSQNEKRPASFPGEEMLPVSAAAAPYAVSAG